MIQKIMVFRKSMHLMGFADKECFLTFKIKSLENRISKMRYVGNIFEDINEGNYTTKVINFVTEVQKKYVEELPPLLDPVICKDIKHYEKAVDAHRQWCMKEWLPNCDNSH
jgi:hypothetical protein